MAGRRRAGCCRAHNPTSEEAIPPPYNTVYTGREVAEDRLITSIMLASDALVEQPGDAADRAGSRVPLAELLEDLPHTLTDDFAEFADLCRRIVAWVEAEPARGAMLRALAARLADGEVVRGVVRNLFPGGITRQAADTAGRPVLTEREVDVLRLAAMALSHEEIAARLTISRRTVDRHMENMYRKLGVHRPIQAVTRAYNMGYLRELIPNPDLFADPVQRRGFEALGTLLSHCRLPDATEQHSSLRLLAEFALLCLAVAGTTGGRLQKDTKCLEARGGVCCLDPRGHLISVLPLPGRGLPTGIAVAPTLSAGHGFTPNHLVVGRRSRCLGGLNTAELLEVSPDGSSCRAFTGARAVAARLSFDICPAFAPDGRLLVTSRWLTDQILEFTAGGARVRPLAHSSCNQIACAPNGQIYGTQHSGIGDIVRVFDASGKPLSTIGGTSARAAHYAGIAVTSSGRLVVNEPAWAPRDGALADGAVRCFEADGEPIWSARVPGLAGGMLAAGPDDLVYACCERTHDVAVLAASGRVVRRLRLKGPVIPKAAAIGDDGLIWVCGALQEPA